MTRTRSLRGSRVTWIAAAVLVVIGAVAVVAWRSSPAPIPDTRLAAAAPGAAVHVRRETRPTLDPARFVGKAAVTHQIARDIPDVLDQLYCYCQCDKSVGHKSLLSCYTDGHAPT
jgi:hypothetical protein